MKEVRELLTRIAVAVEKIADALITERSAVDPMVAYRDRQRAQAAAVVGPFHGGTR